MKSVYNFVVTPIGERYNNKKKIGDKELILNTEIYNHQFVNRLAKVISTPIIGDTGIQPGDIMKWTASGVDYEVVVQWGIAPYPFSTNNRYGIVTQNGEDPAVYPAVSQSVEFISAGNTMGWYSYKVVVKQLEQDYYNVYLPSLLNGTPVIKPFDLTCTFTNGSSVASVDAIGTIEYLTFPLIEGMKVVTAGGNTYFINNILNQLE